MKGPTVQPEVRTVALSAITFDASIYPRKNHDPALVQRYAGCLSEIEARSNFMAVAADLTLVDGRHRHLAYLKSYEKQPDRPVRVYVYPVESEEEKLRLAVHLNSTHGLQLSDEDKRKNALDLYSRYHMPLEDIAELVAVRKEKVLEWTKGIREEEERRLNERIFDMWLACRTQEEIAAAVSVHKDTVSEKAAACRKKFQGTKSDKLSLFEDDDWKPPLYNIWSYASKSNAVSHFGNSEQRILENLLCLYTRPYDIVVDPFAGGGSTIDVCKKRLRRYWVSDRKPIIERQGEIRKLDIVQEMPSLTGRWGDVALTYLDPPYWKQAEGRYSDDPEDLANMTLEDFTAGVARVIKSFASKQPRGVIALLMQPTQWNAPDRQYTDHILQIINAVGKRHLQLVNRVSCPYPTEQYNAQMVEWAKENKDLLVLTRELIIWRIVA